MEELAKLNLENGRITTTSLIVAEVFGKRHADVLRDIQNLNCPNDFIERNFALSDYTNERGKTYPMYEITKDGFSFLVMGYTGEKASEFKVKFINEFNKRSEMLLSEDYILMRSQQIMESKMKRLMDYNNQLTTKVQEQAPKVLFADAVATSDRSCLIGELSKILRQNGYEIGQNRLFEWLRENHFLCSTGERYNQPTQSSMEMGLFEIKKTTINKPDGSILVSTTTKVTGKGQIYFVNKFLSHHLKTA